MSTCSVGYLTGSLARNSINRKLALALTRLARDFKNAIASSDAILFVTPEYNDRFLEH